MANRIKELRNAKNWTLDDFSKVTGIKRGTLSNYENGNTEPKLVTWQKLADALGVPVPYLQGVSDDNEDWAQWANEAGFSLDEVKSEVARIRSAKHGSASGTAEDDVTQAVYNLDGRGETDAGILNKLAHSVDALGAQVDKHFLDPKKLEKYRQEYNGVLFFPAGTSKADAVFDDLSPAAYTRAIEILIQARRDLQNAANDPKYRK